MDEKQAAGCDGKQAYLTFTQAQRVAKRRKRRTKGSIAVEPYRCRFCQCFHLAPRKAA